MTNQAQPITNLPNLGGTAIHNPLVYRMPELKQAVGLSKTTIYQMMKNGDFPAPIQMTGKTVAWRASDVAAWVASRPTAGTPETSID